MAKLTGWLPFKLSPTNRGGLPDQKIQVVEGGSGRVMNSVGLKDSWYLSEFDLLENGTRLAVYSNREHPGGKNGLFKETEALVEIWDVPGPSSNWPVAGLLALVALISGRWYDRRVRRWAPSIPGPSTG